MGILVHTKEGSRASPHFAVIELQYHTIKW